MNWLKRLFCKHRNVRCVHGDEIIRRNWRRVACLDCDASLARGLPPYCHTTRKLHWPGQMSSNA